MDNLINTGSGIQAWFILIKILISVILVILFILSLTKAIKSDNERKFIPPLAWLTATIITLYFFFIAYGSGEVGKIQSQSTPEGSMQMLDTITEKSPKQIKEEREAKRPTSLKRQDDEGFETEKQEADKYIDSVLKEYE